MCWVTWASSLLAFVLYYNTLDADFVYDDRRAILTNPDVIGNTPLQSLFTNDFWGTPLTDPGSHGSYRPICVATFRLNYIVSGLKPWSYHFLSVIFHCCATTLVTVLARRLLPSHCSKVGTLVAGLTFAAHPIHTEAVAGIVGRADLLSCNFFLLAFILYNEHISIRDNPMQCHHIKKCIIPRLVANNDQNFRLSCHGLVQQIFLNFQKLLKAGKAGPMRLIREPGIECNSNVDKSKTLRECSATVNSEFLQWITLVGTVLLGVIGTLCKETGIMLFPLCVLYDLMLEASRKKCSSKKYWPSIFTLSIAGATLLSWRLQIAGAAPTFATADNPASRDPSIITRFLTFAYLPVFNFYLLIYPFHLSFDWSMDAIPRVTKFLDFRNVLTLIFYTVLYKIVMGAIRNHIKTYKDRVPNVETKPYRNKYGHNRQRYRNSYNNSYLGQTYRPIDRRAYHIPHRESSMKKLCPSNGCRHALAEEHTGTCRTANNNNYTSRQATCVCLKSYTKYKQRSHQSNMTTRMSLITFLAIMTLPFVPASNVVFYVGFVVAERVLYIPSVGFCLLLGLGAGLLTRSWNRNEWRSTVFTCGLFLLIVAMCGRTLLRNCDWRSEESLFRSALHINPPRAYGNLGSVLSTLGKSSEAEKAYQRALFFRPNMADVHYNLGVLLQKQRRYEEAIKSFERAIYFRPSMALAYVNLGAALIDDGRYSEAASILRAGTKVDGTRVRDRRAHNSARVSALVQLAALHTKRSQWQKALAAYKEALQIIPVDDTNVIGWTRQDVISLASEVYMKISQPTPNDIKTLEAISVANKDASEHLAYAKALSQNSSRRFEAEKWFKKAVDLAPSDPRIRDQFGQFLRSQQRLKEAAEQLVLAAELLPLDVSRASAAASALRDARLCQSAEKWYARVAELNPEDSRSHSNLGAILHMNGKYSSAASSYEHALRLEPGDKITMTNLQKLKAIISKQSL